MRKSDQKKILVLGGTKHMIEVVENAKRMGMSPIVVDNVVGSPAKNYADKAFTTSTSDIEGLKKIIRDEKVEGVFTAFEDINTWVAVALCKKMNLPFYTSENQMGIAPNMDKFKEICRRFDVSVIEEKEAAGKQEETIVATWEFPIIIKPIGKCASKSSPLSKILKK